MSEYHSDTFNLPEGAPGRFTVMEHYSTTGFPRVLYQANGLTKPKDDDAAQQYERNLVRGRSVDTRVVANKDAQDAALADGWSLTPEETDQDQESELRRGPGRPRRVEA